jgi:tetratricopeptide (TPR) repeat protein
VGDEVLNGVPRAELLRRDLLKRATKKFEEILADSGDDPDVRIEMANAFRLLGSRDTELGDVPAAREAFGRALELVEEARAARPDHAGTQRMRADILYERAILLFGHVNDPAGAGKDATEAVTIYRDLLDRHEHEDWCRTALGNALNLAGQSCCELERYEEGVRLMQEAVARLEDAAGRGGIKMGQTNPADALMMARNNLAGALEHAGRLEESEQAYRSLLDQITPKQGAAPPSVNVRFATAAASSNLGLVLARLERQEEAEPCFRDAIAGYDGLARDFPAMPIYRRELARNHLYLARVLGEINGPEHEEITPLLERAGVLLEAVAAGGTDPIAMLACTESLRRLAVQRFLAGDPARGVERLVRARALLDALRAKGVDESNSDDNARLEHAFALAPPEALPFDQRVDHAEKSFAAAEEFLKLRGEKGADRFVREDFHNAFDALAKLAKEDAAIQPRVEAAAKRLKELLPDDPEAQKRASRFGAGG